MSKSVREVRRLGQSIWYDNIRRGLIDSGELQRLIDMGVTGLTSNPTIFEKAIAGSTDYDSALLEIAPDRQSMDHVFEELALKDIRDAADLLRPVYDESGGDDGYASLEVRPALAHDTEGTVAEGRRLFGALARPNVMIKVPATPEGVPAIRTLIGEGINVNVTLLFSLDAYRNVSEAYIGGLEDLAASGGDLSNVASVASFFVSRVDSAVDGLLDERIRGGNAGLTALLGKAAVANAKLAYQDLLQAFGGDRFAALKSEGAKTQRLLWASTGTKNPAYGDTFYVESLIGPDTVNTMPEATLMAFADHGEAARTIDQDVGEAEMNLRTVERAGIEMSRVTAGLLEDGLKSFAESYDRLLANIGEKIERLNAREHVHPGASLGSHLAAVETALSGLDRDDVLRRLWHKDHTVWADDPEEIVNRLGWLTVMDMMTEQIPTLTAFAQEVSEAGFRHVVLLGMGGSSLGPEVVRQTIGSAAGYPELIVLDSTMPEWIDSVTGVIDPSRTLFLVSSKSGGTVEPNSLYRHFRTLVDEAVGGSAAGSSFVAITDPGTSLEELAQAEGFRRVFSNPSDIGGRYSVLSYFGLVPAALIGVDLAKLLHRADCMREGCASFVAAHDNPGAFLGAAMATLAGAGRDKLTVVTSPSFSSFGLWAEQLIAESLGKDGKGVVPIAAEPSVAADSYGDDRLFVYLRMEGDDNAASDDAVRHLEERGHPVARLEVRDRYDLGAEFFRWEFATAVAGAIISVNPFDQPNVQAAKDMTDSVLEAYKATGKLPESDSGSGVQELLGSLTTGDYLAIMPYVNQTPEADRAFETLRRQIVERYGVATTLGYGPRFLHSTGQLHKGGPSSGAFLQITTSHVKDIHIPGAEYSFGTLADAQALGDREALAAAGRRVARLHIDSDVPAGVLDLTRQIAG